MVLLFFIFWIQFNFSLFYGLLLHLDYNKCPKTPPWGPNDWLIIFLCLKQRGGAFFNTAVTKVNSLRWQLCDYHGFKCSFFPQSSVFQPSNSKKSPIALLHAIWQVVMSEWMNLCGLKCNKFGRNVSALSWNENGCIAGEWSRFDKQLRVVMCCTIGGQGALSCYCRLLVHKALSSSLLSPCFCHGDQSISWCYMKPE